MRGIVGSVRASCPDPAAYMMKSCRDRLAGNTAAGRLHAMVRSDHCVVLEARGDCRSPVIRHQPRVTYDMATELLNHDPVTYAFLPVSTMPLRDI